MLTDFILSMSDQLNYVSAVFPEFLKFDRKPLIKFAKYQLNNFLDSHDSHIVSESFEEVDLVLHGWTNISIHLIGMSQRRI